MRLERKRQFNVERGAVPRLTDERERRTEKLGEFSTDRQTKPDSLVRPCVRGVYLPKLLEDDVLHVVRDAWSLIADADAHAVRSVGPGDALGCNRNDGVLRRELHRIGQEVVEY